MSNAPRPRLWTLSDLMEYLGYQTAESALKAVRDDGIPFLALGGRLGPGDRGFGKVVRFHPAAVEEWALGRLVRTDPAAGSPPCSASASRPGPRGSDWRIALGASRPTGPRGD